MLAGRSIIDEDLVELNGGAPYRAKQEMAMGGGSTTSSRARCSTRGEDAPRAHHRPHAPARRAVGHCTGTTRSSTRASRTRAATRLDLVPQARPRHRVRHRAEGDRDRPAVQGHGPRQHVRRGRRRVPCLRRRVEVALRPVRRGRALRRAPLQHRHVGDRQDRQAAHRGHDRRGAPASTRWRGRSSSATAPSPRTCTSRPLDSSINSTFDQTQPGGQKIRTFLGMPIIQCDALTKTEDVVA
jgi:hypothetical protein